MCDMEKVFDVYSAKKYLWNCWIKYMHFTFKINQSRLHKSASKINIWQRQFNTLRKMTYRCKSRETKLWTCNKYCCPPTRKKKSSPTALGLTCIVLPKWGWFIFQLMEGDMHTLGSGARDWPRVNIEFVIRDDKPHRTISDISIRKGLSEILRLLPASNSKLPPLYYGVL